ncbi:hypothetical protein ET495_08545 [Xylanimonas allomyrinae]|uniref:Uncharacterized protein n=1 Tax=Xylanimonas allomyrinae TaxID=2509459 RepID=A0A4P6EYZ6_9MICO|nr:prealbumin-like fold domain-containing protein [Xylanimonas allomyrinae]QAY63288.1 hypothetical protein ET495_08545 [Xylanimonas allomyrinae]
MQRQRVRSRTRRALTAALALGMAGAGAGIVAQAVPPGSVEDGLSLAVEPSVIGIGDADGFTLKITDTNDSQAEFDSYLLYGIPADWSVRDGQTELTPTSPDPVIYEVDKESALAASIRVVAPSGFSGSVSNVAVGRVSLEGNLVTDFDNGTFDYLDDAKPQLPQAATEYKYHDPTELMSDPGMGCSTLQYGPCDGSYSIWPTSDMNGEGNEAGRHFNNYWADLRSIDNPMVEPTTDAVCEDWDEPGSLSKLDSRNTLQVSDDESRRAGKILVVNGSTKTDLPNEVVRTTVTGLEPGSLYTFSGYIANVSDSGGTVLPVRTGFYLKTSPEDTGTVVGASQPIPKQKSCLNDLTEWTRVTSVVTADASGAITVGVRNYAEGGLGNDLAIDNLSLYPMAKVSVDLAVVAGEVTWSKVGENGSAPLAGSQWSLEGPQGTLAVVDNGDNDTDGDDGVLKVSDLAEGAYTLTETRAPDGYLLDPTPHRFVVGAENPGLDLGPITNAQRQPVLEVGKASSPASGAVVAGGDTISYSVTARNGGNTELDPVTLVDDLADVLDDATLVEGSLAATVDAQAADAPVLEGTTLTWTGRVPPGSSVTVTYQVTVKDGLPGHSRVVNHLTGTAVDPSAPDVSVPSTCVDGTEQGCMTEQTVAPEPDGASVAAGGRVAEPTPSWLVPATVGAAGLLLAAASMLIARRRRG